MCKNPVLFCHHCIARTMIARGDRMGDVQRQGNLSYASLSPKNKEHYKEIARRINAQEGGPPDAVQKTAISNIRSNVRCLSENI